MDRDWDVEWAAIEAEYQAARRAVDAAGLPLSSDLNGVLPPMNSEALASYRRAYKRFIEATEKRSCFFVDRARRDLT